LFCAGTSDRPSRGTVQDEREPAHAADVDADADHLGQRQIRLGDTLDVAESAAAQIERREVRRFSELRTQRVEYDGCFD
jgi:hypothetical protein